MNHKYLAKFYGFIAITLLWYMLSLFLGNSLIPYPHNVWLHLFTITINGTIVPHITYSLFRLLSAIAFALIIGVPIGLIIGSNTKTDQWFSPILYILYPIPKIAFLPVFMALFGLGDFSKITLLFSVLIFQIILATRDGVKQIPIEFHHVALTLELSKKDELLKLYLPHALPNIFSALRISIGISMAVLFFGENYATSYGIGYFIMNNWIMVNYNGMFAGILGLSLMAAFLIYLIDIVQDKVCPWLTYEKRNKI
jgi:NitT/TauT family transport system permease protein